MNYRIQAWLNVVIALIELGVAYWSFETSDPFGVVLGLAFAAAFVVVAAIYFRLGRKRQPRVVIKDAGRRAAHHREPRPEGRAMTTGKDYGRDWNLPAKYADWVLTHTSHGGSPEGECLQISLHHLKPKTDPAQTWREGTVRTIAHFTPPKPKPTLPEVAPGGVVRYMSLSGIKTQATRRRAGVWSVQWLDSSGELATVTQQDADILRDVNAAGFTVELDGL